MNLIRTEVLLFIALMITWVSGQDCGNADLTDYYGTLKSPNYPGKYEHESDCMWTITAPENYFIELEFNDFDVKNPFWDCNFDYVTVMYDDDRSEKFCNHQKPDGMKLKSTSNVLKIHLKSDNFFLNGNGFQATYYVVDEHGNKLEEEEEVEKPAAEETGEESEASLTAKLNQFVNSLRGSDEAETTAVAVTTTQKPKRRGRKGGKGKKTRKSKEERRRERKLRRQKERAAKRKNRKGQKGAGKAKRASKRRNQE